jgi:Iap family predicted aminopeptidase
MKKYSKYANEWKEGACDVFLYFRKEISTLTIHYLKITARNEKDFTHCETLFCSFF